MQFLRMFLHNRAGNRRKFLHFVGQRKKPKVLISLGFSYFFGPSRTLKWWSRGESNPRPQAITGQFYMLSCLI